MKCEHVLCERAAVRRSPPPPGFPGGGPPSPSSAPVAIAVTLSGAAHILANGNGFEVRRVYASPLAAKMIDHETRRNRADKCFIGVAMHSAMRAAGGASSWISTSIDAALPNPAFAIVSAVFADHSLANMLTNVFRIVWLAGRRHLVGPRLFIRNLRKIAPRAVHARIVAALAHEPDQICAGRSPARDNRKIGEELPAGHGYPAASKAGAGRWSPGQLWRPPSNRPGVRGRFVMLLRLVCEASKDRPPRTPSFALPLGR